MEINNSTVNQMPVNLGSNLYNLFKIILLLGLMWILGFGYLLNIAVNSLTASDDRYTCKTAGDCDEKEVCGLTTKCFNSNHEPICISPESPLVQILSTTFEKELEEAGGKTPGSECTCTERKCGYNTPEKNTTSN